MKAFKVTTKTLRVFCTLLLTALTLVGCGRSLEEDDAALLSGVNQYELKFVKDIVLGSEFGGDGRCIRYNRSPKVSLFLTGSDSRARGAFANAVIQINMALGGTGIQLITSYESDETADIKVFFAPLSSFSSIAQRYGIGYRHGNSGFFQSSWNGNHEIVHSEVMIATDLLQGNQINSVVLEELTQSLGLGKDQAYNQDSIFYETSTDPGYRQSYSALDVRVINFFYKNIAAGDGERELNRKFAKNWY